MRDPPVARMGPAVGRICASAASRLSPQMSRGGGVLGERGVDHRAVFGLTVGEPWTVPCQRFWTIFTW